MDIKKITSIGNDLLPGVGLVRTSRDSNIQKYYYKKAIYSRNMKCVFYQLLLTTSLLKKNCYNYNMYNLVVKIFSPILPDDISKNILSYNEESLCDVFPYMNFKDIIYNNKNYYNRFMHKWYITTSNVLYLFEPEYHNEILYISTIHKIYEDYKNYEDYINYSDYLFDIEFNEFYNLIVKCLKTTKEDLYTIMKHFMFLLICY